MTSGRIADVNHKSQRLACHGHSSLDRPFQGRSRKTKRDGVLIENTGIMITCFSILLPAFIDFGF